ncbi:4Fe-4S dicluster domain-containing protein [Clostridium tyrobutyricum]|jgi:NAD-dependent dihydropyrimidine dehydrogenase PreA subunit|uniref:4Fe-4S dicluster domain-containing protein n=1 Tax=Clostridium tyrobutyricum TaxID=1519 RepID=UPI00242B6D11|nr:ferredoxin family protein [Clostridium tyrobutyricum]
MLISWYPTIDSQKCNNCKLCYDSSNCGVLELVDNKVIVAYPEECIWECTKCKRICPKENIKYQLIEN